MNTPLEGSFPDQNTDPEILDQTPPDPAMEERLSGAYRRILRVTIALSVAGTLAAALLFTLAERFGFGHRIAAGLYQFCLAASRHGAACGTDNCVE